jgi:uncharacterized membrane-anchored protein YitT (DUF2179 family)
MHKQIRKISFLERYIMITVGIILMAAGFYFFLIPADLVAGGVTGLALVIYKYTGFTISIFVFIINMVLLVMGLLLLGKKIFIRSIYGSLAFPLVLFLLEEFVPLLDMDNDFVIATIFGGVLLGLGFGYVLRYGGTSGGTDIPIKIMYEKLRVPISTSLYFIDGAIILLGVIAFYNDYGIESGLYAIMTMFISGKIADIVVLGNTSKKAVNIITLKKEEVKEAIYQTVSRGVTEMSIKGGYQGEEKTMLISVITSREYYAIRNLIAEIDPDAFVYVTPATEIQGDFAYREDD